MVSSNKILTVSYGTFSCTLEGFDNSFDTMKAIAEYFRDLAQDDRYFGAEPPTPDAEMLARIAEREIERRVEARFEKGNLVLRPTDDADTPQGDVATEQSSGAALVGAAAGLAATGFAAAQPADAETPTPHDASSDADLSADLPIDDVSVDLTGVDLGSVAEDVDEDEADIDLTSVALDAVEDDPITLDGLEIDEDDDDTDLGALLADTETEQEDLSIDDLIADQGEAEADPVVLDDTSAQVVAENDVAAEIVEDAFDAPADTTDSVAEKLQRIRAVVASKAQEEPDYIKDEHAMSGPDSDGNPENDAIDVDGDIPGFDDDMLEDDDEDNIFADTIAAVVNDQVTAFGDADDDDNDAPGEPAPVAQTDASAELEALRAKVAELEAQAAQAKAMPADDFDVDDEDSILEDEDAGEDAQDAFLDDEDDDEEEDAATSAATSEPLILGAAEAVTETIEEEKPEPLVARVRTAKRADVEAALQAGDIEEYDDEDAFDTSEAAQSTVPGASQSSLTAEQESELARELADLQAEIEDDEDWDFDVAEEEASSRQDLDAEEEEFPELAAEAEKSIRKAVKMTSPARAMLTDTTIEEDGQSVDRLIDQTQNELEEPEGNRRRSAIAHLRAAVAATKAERLLGFGKKEDNQEEPYRDDLAEAVRPRRPKVAAAKSERPAPVSPAPLKLVAEQRIASNDAEPVAPVRPRRVKRSEAAEAATDVAANDTGFAEFAERQGATTLPELLEAAAAYMSFVEGQEQFSRPQLMTKLLQAEGEASSREERLRSFGQLLRDGKIKKKGGGRFAASSDIGFKPGERAAG